MRRIRTKTDTATISSVGNAMAALVNAKRSIDLSSKLTRVPQAHSPGALGYSNAVRFALIGERHFP